MHIRHIVTALDTVGTNRHIGFAVCVFRIKEQTVKRRDWFIRARIFAVESASLVSLLLLLIWFLWTELKHLHW